MERLETSRLHRSSSAFNGILAASFVTTLLAPFLAFTVGSAAAGDPLTGGIIGLIAAPFTPFLVPLVFAFVLACSIVLGWVAHRRQLRHIAFFMLGGMLISLAAWVLTPHLTGLGKSLAFLRADAGAPDILRVALAMAAAGALNGAVYWLILRRFWRRQ